MYNWAQSLNVTSTHTTHIHTHTSIVDPPWKDDGAGLRGYLQFHRYLHTQLEFRTNPLVPEARAVSFIDDIEAILPPELSLDMAAIGNVTESLHERLGI